MPELTDVDGLTAKLHHALGWREGKRNATDQCRLLAHRVISLLRSNLVASGVKRTSITEPDL
jgi:hypothetical protein